MKKTTVRLHQVPDQRAKGCRRRKNLQFDRVFECRFCIPRRTCGIELQHGAKVTGEIRTKVTPRAAALTICTAAELQTNPETQWR
jgi:hypothetical protein